MIIAFFLTLSIRLLYCVIKIKQIYKPMNIAKSKKKIENKKSKICETLNDFILIASAILDENAKINVILIDLLHFQI